MSFKPGEVTAEQALEIGQELAARWTKGRHQYVVAAHTNTNNPHVHIIYNSVNLSCDGKFQDFKRSAIALRRVADSICLQHGLSIIEQPGLSKGYNRAEYFGGEKPQSARDRLRDIIDASFPAGKGFEGFISAMKSAGVEVKRGKHLAFRLPDGKQFVRCRSLGDDYSEDAIRERIAGTRTVMPNKKSVASITPVEPPKPSLLIDIQAKLNQGYGEGFRQWATVYNLKEASRTLIFLQENGVTDYDSLVQKTEKASASYDAIQDRIKSAERRMKEIEELQRQISIYKRTLETNRAYRAAKNKQKFRDANESDIILHQAARKYFDSLGLAKLPTTEMLKQEWAQQNAIARGSYGRFKKARADMIAWRTIKDNVNRILSGPRVTHREHEIGAR